MCCRVTHVGRDEIRFESIQDFLDAAAGIPGERESVITEAGRSAQKIELGHRVGGVGMGRLVGHPVDDEDFMALFSPFHGKAMGDEFHPAHCWEEAGRQDCDSHRAVSS